MRSGEAPANIRVLVRVRPLNEREIQRDPTDSGVLQIRNNNGIAPPIEFGVVGNNDVEANGTIDIPDQFYARHVVGAPTPGRLRRASSSTVQSRSFVYDAVFGSKSTQEQIYPSVKGIIDAVCAGYNGTIVAYGQTGSGKTHTIFGEEGQIDEHVNAGLIQRSLGAIFDSIAQSNTNEDGCTTRTTTKASFFEIYNECVYDLLCMDSSNSKGLPVREDAKTGVYVEGLSEMQVSDAREAMSILRRGMNSRKVAATKMNRVSSRSHALFVLTMKQEYTTKGGAVKVHTSKFTLVDLAGSERQKTTDTTGDRLKEASMINNSLLCLGQVINSLVDREKGKERHVPFRDSKLTFLLRDSWGGNSKTCLVATVTPSISSLSETISTLKFAQNAKLIKNSAIVNENTCGSVAALQAEVARLNSEVEALRARCSNQGPSLSMASSPIAPKKLLSFKTPSNVAAGSSLRNRNSAFSQKVKVPKDSADNNEMQVRSIKKKLLQETFIRKCQGNRLNYILSAKKSKPTCEVGMSDSKLKADVAREGLKKMSENHNESTSASALNTKIADLQKNLDVALGANKSLTKKMRKATDDLEAK
ncbi:hypothetical protein ACHAXR_002819, partial [Thalassiosira sp. AJA248-18]